MSLKPEIILHALGAEGPLSKAIKDYEARPQQLDMAKEIVGCYNQNRVALIEAGTGTGKSLAYLLPAMLWAVKMQERTVISTHTITLQEQLLHKDIPFLNKTLNLEIRAVLVKGMNNYLCLRKLDDALCERKLFPKEEEEELEKVHAWSETTTDGSKSSLSFMPSVQTWERIGAESDACPHIKCHHYKECFFFKARKEAADAHLLIVNHHLLCADLASRAENPDSETGVLPSYQRVVIDEAHHLEDVATDYFASRINRLDLLRLLSKLASDRKAQSDHAGKLTLLRQKLIETLVGRDDEQIRSLLNRLDIDLLGEKQQLNILLHEAFQELSHFCNQLNSSSTDTPEEPSEQKWRLREEHLKDQLWLNKITPKMKELVNHLRKHLQALSSLESDLQNLNHEKLNEKSRNVRIDIQSISSKLQKNALLLENFISAALNNTHVRWMEMRPTKTLLNMHLVDANLDISTTLHDHLFNVASSVILCSATLTTNRSFSFIKKRLGLPEEWLTKKKLIECIYDSPFNYKEQALFVIPTDMPNPAHPNFTKAASEQIWKTIVASKGQAFVLFTSFSMMKACYQQLKERLEKNRFPVFLQGEEQRQLLLKRFRETPYSVLFGTDSFWEGVDVVGDALRCVIIVKLPFRVPSEPIIQAHTEAIEAIGGNAFMEYTVPHAIVKFKQGFGRLIRNRSDRGCVVCLDPRVIQKSYGKLFLESLPPCERLFDRSEVVVEKMTAFYKKAYAIRKQSE